MLEAHLNQNLRLGDPTRLTSSFTSSTISLKSIFWNWLTSELTIDPWKPYLILYSAAIERARVSCVVSA